MRTQKTILNLVYALGSSLLLMLLGFATRRLLVFNFGNDITAASQVVDKLFNFFLHRGIRCWQRHQLPLV